jgi:hypothetical protein
MATNAKNLAELLNTDTTVAVGDIADGSVTTAKLAVGAVTTAKVADNAVTSAKALNLGRRNLLINGAMQVHQRGNQSVSSGNRYSLDRWDVATTGGSAAYNLQQSTDVPTGQGFAKSFKLDVTTADAAMGAGDGYIFRQAFEGQNLQSIKKGTSNAEQVTVQFWVKTTKTGTYIVELYDTDNTRQVSKSYTVSSADTWEYKTVTFPADTSGAMDNDNARSLILQWWLAAGSNFTSGTLNTTWASATSANRVVGQVNALDNTSNNFYVTGVQWELGDAATDFEHRSFGEELTLCQRYFCKSYNYDIAPGASGSVNNLKGAASVSGGTSTSNRPFWSAGQYPVTMRSEPTIVLYHYGGTSGKITGGSFASYDGSAVNIGDRGFNLHPTGNVSNSNDEDHYAIFTASAEL